MKELIGSKVQRKSKSEFIVNGRRITDNQEIANAFNDFFINIGPNLASAIAENQNDPISKMKMKSTIPSLYFSPATSQEIQNIVSNLKNVSSGYDNINADILKHIYPAIAQPLTHLINCSMLAGKVPDELKIAKVIPLFKSNDPTTISNYRQISILPICSKLYERIVYTRLENHLSTNELLSARQFGFRKSHST